MKWTEALQVGTVVVGALGGGGAIVFGLSEFLGKVWMDRLKGDIDARLHRLDAALEHGNFLLKRFAEFELEAITECWRAARACLPTLNATRPNDSGTDEDVLTSRVVRLADTHKALLAAIGRHELFLPADVGGRLDAIGQVVRLELSNIRHHPHFEGRWWDEGEENRAKLKALCDELLLQVQSHVMQIRATAEEVRR